MCQTLGSVKLPSSVRSWTVFYFHSLFWHRLRTRSVTWWIKKMSAGAQCSLAAGEPQPPIGPPHLPSVTHLNNWFLKGKEEMSHILKSWPKLNICVISCTRNARSCVFWVTLYTAALLVHTPKQLSLVASRLQLFHTKLQFEAGCHLFTADSQDKWPHILGFDWFLALFLCSLMWLRYFYPRRCQSCSRHLYLRGKCPLKSHFQRTRIWFQANVAPLRTECNVFSLVRDGKSRLEGPVLSSLTFFGEQLKNKSCWYNASGINGSYGFPDVCWLLTNPLSRQRPCWNKPCYHILWCIFREIL